MSYSTSDAMRSKNTKSRMLAVRVVVLLAAGCMTAGSASAAVIGSAAKKTGSEGSPVSTTTKPCKYVPVAKAATILHGKVKETNAPLGPTCIFRIKGKKQTDTLAIEVISVTTTVHKMKHVSKFKLSGHQGYCGTLGTAEVLVQLPRHQVLDVHAPCAVAKALATVAIRHIKT
jgi:hypothetical protein